MSVDYLSEREKNVLKYKLLVEYLNHIIGKAGENAEQSFEKTKADILKGIESFEVNF